MSEMQFWYREVLSKYADFSGRARRSEYWLFMLFNVAVVTSALFVAGGSIGFYGEGSAASVFRILFGLMALYALAMAIPALAVSVRRLHDTGRTGWWCLIALIPFGFLVLLYFFGVEGDYGPNTYGPDPKGPDDLGAPIDDLYNVGRGH